MPRDGSGNYSIPNTFTPNSVIASAAVNANFSDIATALTGSLARDSQGPMTATLLLHANGAMFEVDPDTGIVRVGANELALRAGGGNIVVVSTSTVSISAAINITGALTLGGQLNFAAGATIIMTGSSAAYTPVELISTEAGAGAGPIQSLYRNSASPAAADVLGAYDFYGQDSGGNKTQYARITVSIADTTNGSEDGSFVLQAMVGGSLTTILQNIGTQWAVPGSLAVTGAITGASQTVTGDQSAATASGSQIATQSDQETATATTKLVPPGRQHFHPSGLKTFAKWDTTGAVQASYNTTSVTDNGTGDWTWNIATVFSSANWIPTFGTERVTFTGSGMNTISGGQAAGTLRVNGYGGGNNGNWGIPTDNLQMAMGAGDI